MFMLFLCLSMLPECILLGSKQAAGLGSIWSNSAVLYILYPCCAPCFQSLDLNSKFL